MTRLVYPGIGTLYAIPQSGWVAVNRRVHLAIQAQPIAAQMTQMMPSYPALLAASQDWDGNLFPALVQQSGQVASLARQSSAQLAALQQATGTLPATGALPPAVASQARAALAGLRSGAVSMAGTIAPLLPSLHKFAQVNLDVDLDVRKAEASLGDSWPPLGAQLARVEEALGLAVGAWSALESDLADAGAPGVSLDMPQLLALDIGAAIASWTEIGNDAARFAAFGGQMAAA